VAEFWSGWWWPVMAAALGLAATWIAFAEWLEDGKPYQLAWSIGMVLYSVAAILEAHAALLGGWVPMRYKIYIVVATSLVGYLGLGSYHLFSKEKRGPRTYLGFLLVCEAIFVWGVVGVRLRSLPKGIVVGAEALGADGTFPRLMLLPFWVTGSLFLLGCALYSVWRYSRDEEFAYRMWASVFIALGMACLAVTNTLATRADITWMLYPSEMVASALLLAGILRSERLSEDAKEGSTDVPVRRAEGEDEAEPLVAAD